LAANFMQKRVPLSPESPNCSTCMLGHVCIPVGMAAADVQQLDKLVQERIRLPKGATLYTQQDKLDAVYSVRYGSVKTQIEDAAVCVIRLSQIDPIAAQLPSLQHQMRRLMSRELERSYQMLASLGSLQSEQRLAGFLLNLSQRYAALGYSSTEFVLRMTREE